MLHLILVLLPVSLFHIDFHVVAVQLSCVLAHVDGRKENVLTCSFVFLVYFFRYPISIATLAWGTL